ncbi:MAG: IgGFc-binding protein [Pseudomonadota bacterium]
MFRKATTFFLILLLNGCSSDSNSPSKDSGVSSDGPLTKCNPGESRCNGNVHQACKDGYFYDVQTCESPQICSVSLGYCADCDPAHGMCKGDTAYECTAEGKVGAKIKICPKDHCENGQCTDPCSVAATRRSYIGCNYWPTVTANSPLGRDFSFSVVVSNPQTEDVVVNVSSRTNLNLATEVIPAQSIGTIKLPWVDDLKLKHGQEASVLAKDGAYHLESSAPVTVYQFNPLNYELKFDCKGEEATDPVPDDGKCNSYTNDASLLIPQSTLTQKYMVVSRPSSFTKLQLEGMQYEIKSPGFFSVVSTQPDNTTVEVTFSANTQAGTGGDVPAFRKGEKGTFFIPEGSVLQILSEMPATCTPTGSDEYGEYCDLVEDYDLTGTIIEADKPIAVFSGHNCTFVPFDKWACDHLEEQLFPVEAWGKHYLGTHTISSGEDPCIYRVLSAEDNNKITFDPPVASDATLKAGEFIEFHTNQDFEVMGTGRMMLVQFMVGQNYSKPFSAEQAPGDPAMALAVPVEQYRTTYQFLSPGSYSQNYVNIIIPSAAEVTLDGEKVTDITPIGSSGFGVAKVAVEGGNHIIEGTMSVGIAVYGVGAYTSYMYPGGLDLKLLK